MTRWNRFMFALGVMLFSPALRLLAETPSLTFWQWLSVAGPFALANVIVWRDRA